MSDTLILTLQIDEAAQDFYEDLRRRCFPPARNLIAAHLTLFHQLPDEDHTALVVYELASTTQVFHLTHPDPRSIGRGVAVFFESATLKALHADLAAEFDAYLIPQDRQRFRPHIVVQNKVDPQTAKATLPHIQTISLKQPTAMGFTLWRYLGGPWERLSDFPFEAQATTSGPAIAHNHSSSLT